MSIEPSIKLPVSVLVEIFNSLPRDEKVRMLIVEYLKSYKDEIERKGHASEGFVLKKNGDLEFDYSLYDEAVYRGKIETYSNSAREKIEALKDGLRMLQVMGENYNHSLSNVDNLKLSQRVGKGEPISEEEKRLLDKVMPLLLNVSLDVEE